MPEFRRELGTTRCRELGLLAMLCTGGILSVCSCCEVQKLDRPEYENIRCNEEIMDNKVY